MKTRICFSCLLGALALIISSTARAESQITAGNARFTVITDNLIRMEYSPNGKFIDEPTFFAFDRRARLESAGIERKDKQISIHTKFIDLTYADDGKPFGPESLRASIRRGSDRVEWKPGMPNAGNLGGTITTLDGVGGPVDLGQGLLSRDGWYVFNDSRGHIFKDDWIAPRPDASHTDWYLFGYGLDYKAALKSLAAIGGPVPMPRKYTLGAWYSRYWPYSADDYRQIIKEYDDNGFPLDVIVMDMDWHITQQNGKNFWTGYTWDPKLIPDPKALLDWFHEQKLAVTLNDHPADGVQPHESMFGAFMQDMNVNPASTKPLAFDASDKKYLDTFWNDTHQPLLDLGVDFWWLDWQQDRYTRGIKDLRNLPLLNWYYYNHTATKGQRGQSFSRWGGWGDHRHPIHFSGDASTSFDMLAFEVPFTSTAGNVGCFFWSHDIGGHMGGRNEESYARWCQFGALSAALRSHSTRDATMDRRPWKYEKWATDSMRKSFQLRSRLFPYIYSSAAQSCKEMIPLIRPMYLEFPELEDAYKNPQQYMFGDDLLVSPITSAGIGPKKLAWQVVWIPPGDWYNFFTGEKFTGPTERLVCADIDSFPLYVRAGAPIPMQSYQHRMASATLDELVIDCFPGPAGSSKTTDLFEDDSNPSVATSSIKCGRKDDIHTLEVSGGRARTIIARFHCLADDATATVNGAPTECRRVADEFVHEVRVTADSPKQNVRIDFSGKEQRQRNVLRRAVMPREAMARELADADDEIASRVLGIGLVTKRESIAIGARPKHVLYIPPGGATDDPIQWTLEEEVDGKTKVLATLETKRAEKTEAPEFDASSPPTSSKSILRVRATYTVGPNSKDTTSIILPPLQRGSDLAMRATASASSSEGGYTAAGAIDGTPDGYPHGKNYEWASDGERAGAKLKLTWDKPIIASRILLWDRPNLDDQITAGRIRFSDGSAVDVAELPNDGKLATEIKFDPKEITWLELEITQVSKSTKNTGLAEIAVYTK